MNLSSELISQFAKLTNVENSNKGKGETTVYGVTVEYNGKMYVKIDGSDLLTPITTTANMKPGERVTVLVKEHNAIVTGNLTNPSAGSTEVNEIGTAVSDIVDQITEFEIVIADKVSTTELDAVNARLTNLIAEKASIEDLKATNATIENLVVDKADIESLNVVKADITNLKAKDVDIENLLADKANILDLNATNAQIENLKAEDATIQNLIAEKASITDLTATNATITELQANKANVTDLNAVKANIEVLEADVADINTVLAGNISSDNIQAGGITSDRLTIANGFIKDAMIDTLTASKITSGSIDTSLVQVGSGTGNLVIADNTIQIKDDTKVRVQIGKDAAGDYSMSVWDSTGKLMFDARGLTADAIKQDIIRDDMIAQNANISGEKIDINSVIVEVNKDTNTSLIKGTKILLDSKGQSLELAFNKMETTIETVAKEVNYDVEIISTNGGVFKNGNISTTLIAIVRKGTKDITDTIAESKFRWTRVSDDKIGDEAWNNKYFGGRKQIQITQDDVRNRATFNCEILE